MPRFLRIENTMVHIPSLSSVSVDSSCLGRPYITLYYHTKKMVKINYTKWEKCEEDFNRVKNALSEIEKILANVPLTEEKEKEIPKSAPVELEKQVSTQKIELVENTTVETPTQ